MCQQIAGHSPLRHRSAGQAKAHEPSGRRPVRRRRHTFPSDALVRCYQSVLLLSGLKVYSGGTARWSGKSRRESFGEVSLHSLALWACGNVVRSCAGRGDPFGFPVLVLIPRRCGEQPVRREGARYPVGAPILPRLRLLFPSAEIQSLNFSRRRENGLLTSWYRSCSSRW